MAVELPAEAHTVIRVVWLPDAFMEEAGDVLLLEENGYWRSRKGLHVPEMLAGEISGYQFLAKPVAIEDAVVVIAEDVLKWDDIPAEVLEALEVKDARVRKSRISVARRRQ